jgi:hypothetical protein
MVVFSPAEAERENYEMAYHGHGRGVVVTNDRGKFLERPMTDAELIARKPAMDLSDNIHRIATYAAFAYIKAWELIAPAIEQGMDHVRGWQPIETAPKNGSDIILWGPCRPDGDTRPYARDANVGWWCADHWRTRTNEVCNATHWMPLPLPPVQPTT